MSAENVNHQVSVDHADTSIRNKKSILCDKTFLIDIQDNEITSKVEKLVQIYGGKIIYSLEKNTDYLISDTIKKGKIKQTNSETSNCQRDIEIKTLPCSNHKNSVDLFAKANLLKIKILSAKQFQRWLKSLLKKNPTDKVASVLKGKVSLKIESMDQSQCPVFEYIPKWPDLGVTLCKKKPKYPSPHNFRDDHSDNYSSNQYSTSEIGGMCELCDMPFMNYKEHINTKKHILESQDESKFFELDELINERPLNVIFNQFEPDKKNCDVKDLVLKTPSSEKHIENIINLVDSDLDEKNKLDCSSNDGNLTDSISKEKQFSSNNIKFVPQKRPSKSKCKKEINSHKKIKRKHKNKLHQKNSFKDIYKVINTQSSSSKYISNDDKIESNKPPVIIRLKRIRHSICKYSSSEDDDEILDSPVQRCIRVVRKPSFSDKILDMPKIISKNHIFTFEHPKLRINISNGRSYYPTSNCLQNTKSCVQYFNEKIAKLGTNNLKCTFPFKKSMQILSNMKPLQVGEWFYNIPNKIQDNLSFNTLY